MLVSGRKHVLAKSRPNKSHRFGTMFLLFQQIPTIYHPFEFHLEMKNSVPLKGKTLWFLQSMSIIHKSADCTKCFLKRVLTADQAFNLKGLLNILFLYTWKLQNRISKTRSLKVFDDVFPAVYFHMHVDVPFCT